MKFYLNTCSRILLCIHCTFYGMSNVPNQVKIGLSAMIALLVSGFADVSQVEYTGLIGYAVIVLKEGITGLLIGLLANVCNSIILFAGNIIDMDIGLSMATEFDPINNAQVTLTGNLYNYFILMLCGNRHASLYITGLCGCIYSHTGQWTGV